MLPWVVLYGMTAFLFNHPSAFSDQPTSTFGPDALRGTPMETPPTPAGIAAEVVSALQSRATSGVTYKLVEPEATRFTREFAFATVKAGNQEVSVLLDATGAGGTVRSRELPPVRPTEEKAPFAVGHVMTNMTAGRSGPRRNDGGDRASRGGDGVKLADPLADRVAASIPVVLERTGMPVGEVTVTSVPDVAFRMADGDKVWAVTYSPMSGAVAGRSADAPTDAGNELSFRRFLLRLHTAHGYPGEVNARWAWAVIVDGMAFIMMFWAVSGLLMWWQIKATRGLGAVVLVVSGLAATAVGYGMHELLAQAGR